MSYIFLEENYRKYIFMEDFWGKKKVSFFYIKVQNQQHGIRSLILKTGAASSPVHQIP